MSVLLLVGGLRADTFFSLEKVPAALNATIAPHQDIDLMLEENSSTGYVWKAIYDARLCSVSMEHKRPEYVTPDGSGGYVEMEVKPASTLPFTVTLVYVKANVQNASPLKTMKMNVSVTGAAVAAPGAQVRQPAPAAAQVAVPQPSTAVARAAVSQPVPAAAQVAVPQLPAAQIPFLIDDQSFAFESVPAALQVSLFTGQDIDFDLEEKPGENLFWRLVKYDPSICRIEIDHERGGFWKRPKAEIEIKALRSGSTVIEFSAGAGAAAKTLRCIVTVQ